MSNFSSVSQGSWLKAFLSRISLFTLIRYSDTTLWLWERWLKGCRRMQTRLHCLNAKCSLFFSGLLQEQHFWLRRKAARLLQMWKPSRYGRTEKKIYIYIHTHVIYTCIRAHTHTRRHVCTYTYIHIHTHACMHAYTHTYIHTHAYTYMHTHRHTYTRTHIHTHACMHTCTHTYIHTHAYTHTHAHKYTRTCMHTYIHTYIHTHTHTHTIRGVNGRVRHDTIYRFSYPTIRYLPIPQKMIRYGFNTFFYSGIYWSILWYYVPILNNHLHFY